MKVELVKVRARTFDPDSKLWTPGIVAARVDGWGVTYTHTTGWRCSRDFGHTCAHVMAVAELIDPTTLHHIDLGARERSSFNPDRFRHDTRPEGRR